MGWVRLTREEIAARNKAQKKKGIIGIFLFAIVVAVLNSFQEFGHKWSGIPAQWHTWDEAQKRLPHLLVTYLISGAMFAYFFARIEFKPLIPKGLICLKCGEWVKDPQGRCPCGGEVCPFYLAKYVEDPR